MHLAEFAALQMKEYNDAVDMEILVRKMPFREERQGGFHNDVDSDSDSSRAHGKGLLRSEFLGAGGESDGDEIEDMDGELMKRL